MDNLDEIKKLNKCEIIQIFNDQVLQFINELEIIVNDFYKNNIIDNVIRDDIIFYKNLANTSLQFAHGYIIESFGKYIVRNPDVVPAIMSKDLNFILNYKFENDSSINKYKETYKNNLEIQDLIGIIKQSIVHFNDENKCIMFEYFQIFSQLTIIYMSKM
jgi:hypothetical protein